MKKIDKMTWIAVLTLMTGSFAVNARKAEESTGLKLSAGADLVSSYVWRGQYLNGISFQPSIGISYAGLSLTAWGSSDFVRTNELDFTLSYGIGGFSVAVTDYYIPVANEVTGDIPKYFDKGVHVSEGTAGFDFARISEKFPLTVTWNTIFLNDKKINDEGKEVKAFSTYINLTYPVKAGDTDMNFSLGLSPWQTDFYASDGFSVILLSVKGSKDLKFTERFSLPAFAQIIVNPRAEAAHFVFGLSF